MSWDDLRVLLAVHRHGSLLAAASWLGVSTSTVSRRIDALERALGRRLVLRTSQGTLVDREALELVSLADEVSLGLLRLRREAKPAKSSLAGTVRLSTGDGFVPILTSILAVFRREHPNTHVELLSEERASDLARREADLGLRSMRSRSKVLVERKLVPITMGLYASRDYVARRGLGLRLTGADFAQHDWVGYAGPAARMAQQQWLVARGATSFAFLTNAAIGVYEAIRCGHGLGLLPDAQGHADPQLVRLGVDDPIPPLTNYLAYHRDLRRDPKVRAVRIAIEEGLRAAAEAVSGSQDAPHG